MGESRDLQQDKGDQERIATDEIAELERKWAWVLATPKGATHVVPLPFTL